MNLYFYKILQQVAVKMYECVPKSVVNDLTLETILKNSARIIRVLLSYISVSHDSVNSD